MKFARDIGNVRGNYFIPIGREKKIPLITIKCSNCGCETDVVTETGHIENLEEFECENCNSTGFLKEM